MPRALATNSHTFVDYTAADDLEEVFAQLQGEVMTETRRCRVQLSPVRHITMSVGDLLIDEAGHLFAVMPVGFKRVRPAPSSPVLSSPCISWHWVWNGHQNGLSCSNTTRRSWVLLSPCGSEPTLTGLPVTRWCPTPSPWLKRCQGDRTRPLPTMTAAFASLPGAKSWCEQQVLDVLAEPRTVLRLRRTLGVCSRLFGRSWL